MVSLLLAAGLIIAAIVVILALHLFLLPVRLSARVKFPDREPAAIAMRWGLLRAYIRITLQGKASVYLYSFRVKEFPLSPPNKKDDTKKESGTGPEGLGPVIDGGIRVLGEIGFDYFRAEIKIGTGDAYTTGILTGLAAALDGIVRPSGKATINVLPVFDTEALEIDLEAGFKVRRPFMLIAGIRKIASADRKRKAPGMDEGAAPQ